MTETERHDEMLDQARERMSRVAFDLARFFSPFDAVGTLVGAAIALLIDTIGKAEAARYVRELAELIELEGSDPAGHA